MGDCQHGFRKDRSCETQLVYLYNDLASTLEKKQITDAIILDFFKAFDSVNHRNVVNKLRGYGVNNQIVSWAISFLKDREQAVAIGGFESDIAHVSSGVPQGSVLGLLLFLIYINYIPKKINSKCRLFANDAAMYNTISNYALLQRDIDFLGERSRVW